MTIKITAADTVGNVTRTVTVEITTDPGIYVTGYAEEAACAVNLILGNESNPTNPPQ